MATTLPELVSDTSALHRYALRFKSWNPKTLTEETHYYSDHGLTSLPEEAPPNTLFPGRIDKPLTFSRSMFSGTRLGGRALPDFGEIVLNNKDHGLDFLLDNEVDGRECEVFIGGETDIWTTYFQIFKGFMLAIEAGEDSVSLRVQSPASLLDRVVHQAIYGDSAEDDIIGKPIPECHGEVKNITPVLIDSTGFVYQVHNGQIEAIVAVYVAGVLKTLSSDYTVDLNAGTFTLLASPDGAVTADVRGSKKGGVYNTKVGDIIKRIAGYRGITSFDDASFSALNTAFPATVGVYIKDPTNTLQVLDFLINSAGGFYGFNRVGQMTVGRIGEPGPARTLLSENKIRNTTSEGVERCNDIRNTLMTGAVAASDTYPDFWAPNTEWQAIDDLTEVGVEDDIEFIEIRLNGTPTGNLRIAFDDIFNASFRESHFRALGVELKLVAGDFTNVDAIRLGFDEYDVSVKGSVHVGSGLTVTGTQTKFSLAAQGLDANADSAQPYLELTHTAGAIDLTLRIYRPMFETGRDASTFVAGGECAPLEGGADTGQTIPPAVPTISRALVFTRGGEISSGTPDPSVNTYMHRMPGAQGNRRTWTFATWFRRHNIHSDNEYLWWTISGGKPTFDEDSYIGFIADTNKLRVTFKDLPTVPRLETTTAFTREDAWTHLVVAVDTTQAVEADRVKVYINSIEEALIEVANGYPAQNYDTHFNRTAPHFLGRREFNVDHLNAVQADTYWVDGLQLTPGDFTTWTGTLWVPKTYAGAMGTNGFHLDYADNSSIAALGNDVSAAGNDLTVENFLTTDQTSSDLPTSPVTVI